MRLVCVSNGPLPYHTPILNELAQRVDLHVLYMSEKHPLDSFRELWGTTPEYPYEFHWSKRVAVPPVDFRTQLSVGASMKLRRLAPDVILFSSWGPLVWEPLLWKTIERRAAVMWSESTSFSGLLRDRVSDIIRRAIVSTTDAFVANGSCASAYLGRLGVASERIVTSCLPAPVGSRSDIGAMLPARPVFLFVGRLIERKRPLAAVEAFERVATRLPDAELLIVGDGPLEVAVRGAAERCQGRVRLLGRLEGAELAGVYAGSDMLVVPSVREVWGLVVNEALAHGVHVVATDEVGSAHDLLDDPALGTIVPASDKPALAEAMLAAATHLDETRAARPKRRERVAACTPRAFAADIEEAAKRAHGSKRCV